MYFTLSKYFGIIVRSKGEEILSEKENEKMIVFMLIHLRSLSYLARKYFLFCVILVLFSLYDLMRVDYLT